MNVYIHFSFIRTRNNFRFQMIKIILNVKCLKQTAQTLQMVKQLPSCKAPHFMMFTIKKHGPIIDSYPYSPLNMVLIKNISIFTKKLNTTRANNENGWLMQYMKQYFLQNRIKTLFESRTKLKHYLKIRIQENLFFYSWCKTQHIDYFTLFKISAAIIITHMTLFCLYCYLLFNISF